MLLVLGLECMLSLHDLAKIFFQTRPEIVMRAIVRSALSSLLEYRGALEACPTPVLVKCTSIGRDYLFLDIIISRIIWILSLISSVYKRIQILIFGVHTADAVELSYLERRVILPLLRLCSIPKHVGFIMDGNRRYARSHNASPVMGHKMGYNRLRRVLLWCFEVGMDEVSVYAFSVDNFARPQEEVDYLMELAESKLVDLCQDGGFIMTSEIRVRVCGETSLLRPSLQQVIKQVELKTAHHTRGVFNVLFAYSSKRELSQAIEKTVHQGIISSWDDISKNLYNDKPLDLIVRTSGETRLSDFLVWQIQPNRTVIVFDKHYWPDYSITDFMLSLLRYNYSIKTA